MTGQRAPGWWPWWRARAVPATGRVLGAVLGGLGVVLGVVVGVVSAAGELLALLVAGAVVAVAAPVPPARRRAVSALVTGARRVARWERRRQSWPRGRAPLAPAPAPAPAPGETTAAMAGPRLLAFLAARLLPGALGALAVGLLGVGAVLGGVVARSALAGTLTAAELAVQVLIGSALLVVNLQAIASIAALDRWLARTLLDGGDRAVLRRRIDELTASRAGVMAAVDAERRRIERDLHDGLQQRLVALGMLLGRARRSSDPDAARELLARAHDEAQRAIGELREVAWRVYPSALDHGTLDEVLALVVRQSTIPVTISYQVAVRPPRPVETVLYFVACEAITNAVKHSGATTISVLISDREAGLQMQVRDDGTGGADPDGSGLQGLARRVAALDGRFEVRSPAGGPTTVTAVWPCG